MALDRQSIEKKDFPVGRQGYDPEAVDSHLSALADEIAELKRSSRKRTDTLASSASDQVRQIVEAAETSAADIQREAESDAREIRDEANSEAQATRRRATEQADEYIGKVSESTDSMVTRLASMQTELDGLIETLRGGSTRLSSDLKLLQTGLSDVDAVASPRPAFEPETPPAPPAPPAAPSVADDFAATDFAATDFTTTTGSGFGAAPEEALPAGGADDVPLPNGGDPIPAAAAGSGAEPATSDLSDGGFMGGVPGGGPRNGGGTDEDAEGARLIALNMALNGTPREETARYLDENFALADAGGLLDEVYASVEG